ncbi:hypothetical protein E2986_13966 [Frieseomelitta varia]|uniref:Odorant receptor n=1 Tax=Frieseomelitta varia TaxID=561572 RepID=A0A833S8F0_9HYME|nr:hypothetical protein E2986_13966 [Frieseomelitta varia]
MAFLKILVLLAHKEDFFRLILYLQERFLYADYNDYEKRIIIGCKRKCIFFVSFLTISIMATLGAYVLKPIIETSYLNIYFSKYFKKCIRQDTSIQHVLSLYHIGITYFCFDNFLCILNLHVAAQFRILQYRISNITDLMNRETLEINQTFKASSSCFANKYYETFKKCIRQHQALIAYCKKLEEVFNLIVLVQILVFSMMICLHGYQILIAKTSNIVRTIFICHISGCLCQLLMFTYSCDCIIRESLNIAIAVYRGPWPFLPSTTSGRMMRKDLTIVIMRSSIPCYLTGRGFFIVSLETYTSIVSDRLKSNMSAKHHKDISFRLTTFFLKVVGLWLSTTRVEKWLRNAVVVYTILTIIFSAWIHSRNLYFSWGDFSISSYIVCNLLGLFTVFFKIVTIFIYREKFFRLIVHMQENFWHFSYDQYENSVLANTKRMCIYFVCVFSIFSQFTVFSYIMRPIICKSVNLRFSVHFERRNKFVNDQILANIGKNKSERILIFDMHLDLPLSISPYYEIMYLIQTLALYQNGVCYLCIDDIFCIMCLHVAGQFRILQYRMENVLSPKDKDKLDQYANEDASIKCYAIFKNCIQQHQILIEFYTTLEEIFTIILLGQVLTFSILICFIGYQAFLVELPLSWRISLVLYLTSNIWQLWIFTYSCDFMAQESMNIANAAYIASWIYLPMDRFGKMIRKGLQFVIMRSRRPCYLTACGFFPISLETFTKISSYMVCNLLGMFLVFLKIVTVFIYKEKFFRLIVHMQENFWHFNYDQYENSILADTKRMCIYFVCVFSIFSQFTAFSYIINPVISNIGRNATERILIFDMHLDLPLSTSPYYEIMYLIQALAVYQNDVCYLCIDDIFCIMCLHAASQFRILQYRIANVPSLKIKDKLDQYANEDASIKCYAIFKNCIQQHQTLIEFSTTLEEIFTIIVLGQVLTFSILICFVGYLTLLVELTLSSRISLICFLSTNISQLWIFTYSCDFMAQESMNVANAVYTAPWIYLPMDRFGKMIRQDLQIVMMRSRRACYLTACGFFPISLETFTKVILFIILPIFYSINKLVSFLFKNSSNKLSEFFSIIIIT